MNDYLTRLRVALSNDNESIETFPLKSEIKQGTLILPLLPNMFLEGLGNVIIQRRERINKGIGKKDVKVILDNKTVPRKSIENY